MILRKIVSKLQVQYSPFFSSPVDSIQAFGVDRILSSFQMPSNTGAPHNNSLLAIHLLGSAEDISEGSSCLSRSVQPISRLLSHSSLFIQPVQSFF